MAGDQGLLDALAAGGQKAADAYQANKRQTDAIGQDALRAALAGTVAAQATPEAQAELYKIQNRPILAGNDLAARQTYAQLGYQNALKDAEKSWNATYEGPYMSAIQRQLAESLAGAGGGGGGSSGGGGSGGGGGGGGRGRKGRSSGGSSSSSDWVKQLRIDAGLVGSGLRTKSAAPAYLRTASKAEKGSLGDILPRDLREREYLQSHYGAPANELDKAAPVSGFLEKAINQLVSARENNISLQRYMRDTHKAAKSLKGDQRRAVNYVELLAQQYLGRGGNPLGNAANIISGAPAKAGGAINTALKRAVGGLF